MMQPAMDPLSQLAMCCGLNRKRGYRQPPLPPRGFYYSPSHAHFDTGSTWPMATAAALGNQFGGQMQAPQPYLLVTQPVILTTNNPLTNQTSTTMATLVPQAQQGPGGGTYQTLSIMPASQQHIQNQQQHQMISQTPRLIQSSQYAIYQSPQMHQVSASVAQGEIYGDPRATLLSRMEVQQQQLPMMMVPSVTNQGFTTQPHQQQPPLERRKNLSSGVFRQIEMIEKQVDLSRDMEFVERNQVVITRAIEPHSLMPHLTEATLMRYNNHFLISDDYVIRFIEVIKRPGQTLGIYIRTVQFEGTRGAREGVVITKIDSESPVYNSQVLHVGDEIISINLVDIQGMGLDDVVIIMSIPKRLVLAIRIPKERDQLLKLNMAQQQHQLQQQLQQQIQRLPVESRAATLPIPYSMGPSGFDRSRMGIRDDLVLRSRQYQQLQSYPNQSMMTPMNQQSRINNLSPMDEFAIDDMRREMSKNMLSNVNTDELYHARPVRVQSAIHMNDISDSMTRGPRDVFDHQDSLGFTGSPHAGPRQYSGSVGVNNIINSPDKINFDEQIRSYNNDQKPSNRFPSDSNNQQRPLTLSKSREDMVVGTRGSLEHREFPLTGSDVDSDFNGSRLDQLRGFASGISSSSNGNNDQHLFADDDSKTLPLTNSSTSTGTTVVTPRRTLPQPPDSGSVGESSSSIKQPIISNIRLGDTPEQSSYFSSSIDAINRELKELRRQRMALSNNEQSLDSTRPDYRGSPV